jgi:hypothetical protein
MTLPLNTEKILEWVKENPKILSQLNELIEKEKGPVLERMEVPPHGMVVEYFWFNGGIYRREWPESRPDSRRWSWYSEAPLDGGNPWWRWEDLDPEGANYMDQKFKELS